MTANSSRRVLSLDAFPLLQMRYLGHNMIMLASGLCWLSECAGLGWAAFHPWQ
jgi:hypothetical protein